MAHCGGTRVPCDVPGCGGKRSFEIVTGGASRVGPCARCTLRVVQVRELEKRLAQLSARTETRRPRFHLRAKIEAYLRENAGADTREIADALGEVYRVVGSTLSTMRAAGTVTSEKGTPTVLVMGGKPRVWRWRLVRVPKPQVAA